MYMDCFCLWALKLAIMFLYSINVVLVHNVWLCLVAEQ
jgi:hypothetical protein